MSSRYRFNTTTNPISMYEFDDGIWEQEHLSLNETLTLNNDNTITLSKTYATYVKVETFAVTTDTQDDADIYSQLSEIYTTLDGTFIRAESDEGQNDDNLDDSSVDDGIDDDHDGDGSNDDHIEGTDDDDNHHGGGGDDSINGGAGDDELHGNEGDDELDGGDGNDIIVGGVGFDVIHGGTGDDDIDGNEDDDILEGAEGSDNLDGGVGDDYLNGGVDNDILNGGDGDDYLLGGDGVDNLTGGSGNDELYAGSGNDTVDGGVGDDLIIGGDGAGDDRYVGGSGIDTVKYSSATAGITVNLTTGRASSSSIDAGIGLDTLSTIENLQGGDFNDLLTGSSLANRVEGGSGADTINGLAGNDSLFGDAGDDTLNGGTGFDFLFGGTGNDIYLLDNIGDQVSELNNEGVDIVQSSVSVSSLFADDARTAFIDEYVENIQLTGSSAINATGNNSDNMLVGNSGANILRGGIGHDVLTGGLGKDTLYGGAGNDVFNFDFISESKTGSARDVIADFLNGDLVDLSGIDAKTGFSANDSFTFLGSTGPTTSNANGALWFKSGVLYGSTDKDIAPEFEIGFTGVNLFTYTDFVL